MSKESFKQFVQSRPELADYVIENNVSWQKLYETYDMYGESSDVWNKYKPSEYRLDFLSKLDTDSLTKHIETAQKALTIISELTTKTSDNIENNIKPSIERPINKLFKE